jgi:hypothetical protein
MSNILLNSALYYAGNFGWPVFPVHSAAHGICSCRKAEHCSDPGKHPHTRHGFKNATINSRIIRTWWRRWPQANVAIPTGPPSDLFVFDLDMDGNGEKSLAELAGRLEPLPPYPVARTGSGGCHVLLQHPGIPFPSLRNVFPGIDIRCDGGYIVAPNSVHFSGNCYEWIRDPGDVAPPLIPESWLNFLCAHIAHRHIDTQDIQGDARGVLRMPASIEKMAPNEWVTVCIDATAPKTKGIRHDLTFRFSRMLQAHPVFRDLPAREMKEHFRKWYERARPFTKMKTFTDFWFDFAEGWSKVRHPIGTGPMIDVIERAKKAKPLARAVREYENPKILLLVTLCRELQKQSKDSPFFLSCRTASAAIGKISFRQALTWLNGLVIDGFIIREKDADKHRRRATYYRYIGG